jgi:cytochrome c-type protein NapB
MTSRAKLGLGGCAAALALLIVALAIPQSPSLSESPEPLHSNLRGPVPLNEEGPAHRMTPEVNTADREIRNYPEQPPLVPHRVDCHVPQHAVKAPVGNTFVDVDTVLRNATGKAPE